MVFLKHMVACHWLQYFVKYSCHVWCIFIQKSLKFVFHKSIESQCCLSYNPGNSFQFLFHVGCLVGVSNKKTMVTECTGQQNQKINLYRETSAGEKITKSSLERKWTAQTKRVDEITFPPSILTSAGFPLSLFTVWHFQTGSSSRLGMARRPWP